MRIGSVELATVSTKRRFLIMLKLSKMEKAFVLIVIIKNRLPDSTQLKMLNLTGWMNGLTETIIYCADLMRLCLIPCAKFGGNARNVVICTRCLQK